MTIFPKGSAKGSPSKAPPSIDPALGSYVQYEDNAAVILGVVTTIKKDKLLVLNERGREIELGRGRLYFLPGKESGVVASTAARVEALNKLNERIEKVVSEINVAELWSFTQEEKRVFQPGDLSTSYFGSDTLERHAAIRVALIRERTHFKRDKDGFEPRTPEIVEELLKAEAVKLKKAAVREATLEFFKQKEAHPEAPVPRELEENLQLISEVAAGVVHTDPSRQKEGKDLVHLCVGGLGLPEAMPMEKQAFEILVRMGYFHKNSNLSFIRHDIPVEHSADAVEEAKALEVPTVLADFPEEERSLRLDLTGKETFTIDDESTRDMDDAISVEQTVDGFELGIHITDVAWAVLPETALDRSARRRATSLYAADRTINMFPEELSEQKLSLRQGLVRPCISVLVSLDREYRIVGSKVAPTFINVARRLSYDEVDRLLEAGDSTLLTVNDIAAACEEERIRNGAVKVHKREVIPFVEEDGSIRLQEIDEDSHSRALVAEMMVLANSVMANFARDHGIPVLFRGQERP
jgi:exoribonuclease-2